MRSKAKKIDLTLGDCRRLEDEMEQLRVELAIERAERRELEALLERFLARDAALAPALTELRDALVPVEGEAPFAASPEPAEPPAPAEERVGADAYVFDDDDETRAAFDAFLATPDPQLDRVRRFLLG